MQKILIIFTGLLVIVGIVGLILFKILFSPSASTQQVLNNTGSSGSNVTVVSSSTDTPTTATDTITMALFGGGTVEVRDFLKDQTTVPDPVNKGYYYLGYHNASAGVEDPTATENPPYIVGYIASTQFFNISLLAEPLRATRQQAEQDLIKRLGISEEGMCRLKYMISVPYRVNQTYSSMNLGFSFCPGAVLIP